MKIYTTEEINAYGITATITNFYYPPTGGCRVRIKFEDSSEEWYWADTQTYFKGFMGTPQKLIVNEAKSLLYPNSATHPVKKLPKLPAELEAISYKPTKG